MTIFMNLFFILTIMYLFYYFIIYLFYFYFLLLFYYTLISYLKGGNIFI